MASKSDPGEKLVGERVRILHYRGGASQFGVIEKCHDPDTFLVQMDGDIGVIPVALNGFEFAPPDPEPAPEVKPKPKPKPRAKPKAKPKPKVELIPVAQTPEPEPQLPEPESTPEPAGPEPRRHRFRLWRRKSVEEVES